MPERIRSEVEALCAPRELPLWALEVRAPELGPGPSRVHGGAPASIAPGSGVCAFRIALQGCTGAGGGVDGVSLIVAVAVAVAAGAKSKGKN